MNKERIPFDYCSMFLNEYYFNIIVKYVCLWCHCYRDQTTEHAHTSAQQFGREQKKLKECKSNLTGK